MQPQTSEALRAWFRGVEPVYAELFNAAYAMCGNYDLAEYALRGALVDVWLQNASGGMGFRERLRASLRREAFEAALSDAGAGAEFTWPGLILPREDDPVLAQLGEESVETQRLAVLRHGCGLSYRAIARLTDTGPSQVRAELERFEARCRRRLSGQDRARADLLIARRLKRLLSRRTANTPHPGQVYRAFEAEAGGASPDGHRIPRIAGGIALALMALLCAGAFWLFAVLVQPPTF